MGKCEHLWQQTSKVCPYGFKLPMDVTWPDAARARSFGLPDHELATNQVWIFVNVLYSYVPAVMMAVQLVRLVVVRGSRELCIASVLVFTFILNELILKHIFSVPRPEESCCTSCGMPSSHSAFAASLLGFHLCDLLWRLSSRPFPWVNRDDVAESVLEVLRAACRHWDELDALQCGLISLFWSLLLIPVPFTRVILGDHSIEQVLLGSLVGFSASLIVWIAARTFLKNHNHHLDDEQFCGGWRLISHNMALPISSLFRRMQHQQLRPQELLNQQTCHKSTKAQRAFGKKYLRLITAKNRVLVDFEQTLEEAEIEDGECLTALVLQPQLAATNSDFALWCHGDSAIVTWGDACSGGDKVQDQLRGVQQIQATHYAFAAILEDGSVVTWGVPHSGSCSSAVQDQLKGVQKIQAANYAFAAILGDGSVVTWGNPDYGGDSSAVGDQLKGVLQIQATKGAFAAI
eukprot:symbB.v1.2.029692.t1/scaffold3283.1/size59811/3